MSLSTDSTADQPATVPTAPAPTVPASGSLLAGSSADRCAVCDAQLAIDQRYCVECGTRRGNPRFTLARPAPATATSPVARAAAGAITRLQLAVALLTVLVAVGVGVLIGHGTTTTSRVSVTGATSKATGSTKPAQGTSSGGGAASGNLFPTGG